MTQNQIPMTRKEREEAFRRDLVLDIAERLFAEKGIDGTTVSDIAEKSELAKGSLYQLFESKQQIVEAIVLRKIGLVISDIDEVMSQQIDPLQKILSIMEIKLRRVWESRDFAKLFMHEFHGFNWYMEIENLQCCREEMMNLLVRIEKIVTEAQDCGQLRPDMSPAIILSTMAGISNAVIHLYLRNHLNLDVEPAVQQTRLLFLQGVRPVTEEKLK